MSELGVKQLPVTRAECLTLEPALAGSHTPIVGGIHTPGDESGDAMHFSQALAGLAAQGGVTFRHGCTVQRLDRDGTRIATVHTDQGPLQADWVVLSLGSYSTAMARPLGLRLPVHPVKGYSVTIPVEADAPAPRMSLYDEAHKIGISRLGDRLRAGGTAEFAGFDTSVDSRRARALELAVEALVPTGLRREETSRWAGLRPMTPDGMPILGHTPISNLLLNTGHGTLGWTLACASGQLIADLIADRAPAVDADGFSLARF
jgi:D-amino-acid dehydrogenase